MVTRAEKAALKRADAKEVMDRVERIVGRMLTPEAIKLFTGAALGVVALRPQRFILEESIQEMVVRREHLDPKAAEQCEREYESCLAGCGSLTTGRRECIELCGEARNRCLNAGGRMVFDWDEETWIFRFKVEVLAQNLMPNVDIPIAGWPIRDAMAITTWKRATGRKYAADGPYEGQKRAQKAAEDAISADLMVLGIGTGAVASELIQALGAVLRGIGEVVPG